MKEGHFFDRRAYDGAQGMATFYPKCRRDRRFVATDMSPRYLLDPDVPGIMAKWYGQGLKPHLKFILTLREPVARFHSDFYHAVEGNWCSGYYGFTFRQIVNQIVVFNRWKPFVGGHRGCSDRLEASLYKRSLLRWFSIFTPNQFIIVPYTYITKAS